MYKLFPGRSPTQMRSDAARARSAPLPKPAGPVDSSRYPQLQSETPLQAEATAEWLAHIAAGRIEVK